jgi:peptide/nickel transport system permease protein
MIGSRNIVLRIAKFSLLRGLSLGVVVIVSVYLTILITNKSVVIESELDPGSGPIQGWFSGVANPSVRYNHGNIQLTPSEFFQNSIRLLYLGLTLNLGDGHRYYLFGSTYTAVNDIILDSLPRTMLLFGTSNLLIFFLSIPLALHLSRHYGSRLDKFILSLSPISTIPAWIYGVFITVFLAKGLGIFTGGILSTWPDEFSWSFVITMAKHLAPAILAFFLSKFFMSVYAWRSFLLIFSQEDYMDLAKAKGLPPDMIDRRYILRPALPNVITSFTMLMIAIWQEALIVELFFSIRGIGHVFYNAIRYNDMATIIGITVTFAYLMAFSVFLLDIIYSLIDPRVRVGETNKDSRVAKRKSKRSLFAWFTNKSDLSPVVVNDFGEILSKKSTKRLSNPFRDLATSITNALTATGRLLREIIHYPTASVGLLFICGLVVSSIYVLIAYPYQDAVRRWNYEMHLNVTNPKLATPEWFNLFRRQTLPNTIILDSDDPRTIRSESDIAEGMSEIIYTFSFDYPYTGFPEELVLSLEPDYQERMPHVEVTWNTPDGRQIRVGEYSSNRPERYYLSKESRLTRRLGGETAPVGLFRDPESEQLTALPGQYELIMSVIVFEENSDLDASIQITGKVHGLAGTDHRRRDLTLALLWGAPIALAIGFLGAIGTGFTTMFIAAVSTWYGGWVDNFLQRLTEINMILPMFPIMLIIYNFYSKSLWVILGVAILLGIFGTGVKNYRSVFLQIRESPYIEAARAYGAGNLRIITKYMLPHIFPVLIPQLVILVPSYVFLEATLAYLNMSDVLLPTWGKVIREAIQYGGLEGATYWLMLPLGLLVFTSFAFLMVGYALERTLNPKLKDVL